MTLKLAQNINVATALGNIYGYIRRGIYFLYLEVVHARKKICNNNLWSLRRWCLALDFIIYQTWEYSFNFYCNICFVVSV